MQASILALQQRWATKKVLIAMAIIYLIFPLYLLPQILPEGRPLDLYIYYTPTEAFRLLQSYGELNRQSYILGSATIDMLYPLFYSSLFGLLLTFFIKPCYGISHRVHKLQLFPYLVMIADVLENIAIISLLSLFPEKHDLLAIVASCLTFTKWILSLLTVTLVIYFAVQFYKEGKEVDEFFDNSAGG